MRCPRPPRPPIATFSPVVFFCVASRHEKIRSVQTSNGGFSAVQTLPILTLLTTSRITLSLMTTPYFDNSITSASCTPKISNDVPFQGWSYHTGTAVPALTAPGYRRTIPIGLATMKSPRGNRTAVHLAHDTCDVIDEHPTSRRKHQLERANLTFPTLASS